MKRNDDDVVTWTFNGQHISCAVREACDLLRASHPSWSEDQIEQELFTLIVVEGRA
jgi:hypothetical protein